MIYDTSYSQFIKIAANKQIAPVKQNRVSVFFGIVRALLTFKFN
jgi:hypothetical protein